MLLEEGACYNQCVLLSKLLAFAPLLSVLQGQICLLPRYSGLPLRLGHGGELDKTWPIQALGFSRGKATSGISLSEILPGFVVVQLLSCV